MKHILRLNSASPRRRELLQQIHAPFELALREINETPAPGERAHAYVKRLAEAKALAGFELNPSCPCMGADTVVVSEHAGSELILGKPNDEAQARQMLLALSGAWHTVLSAVSIRDQRSCETRISESKVRFAQLDEPRIANYWASGEPADKAGGYGIQGLAAVFVEEIQGSYSGIMGLPLAETAELLDIFNLPYGLSATE